MAAPMADLVLVLLRSPPADRVPATPVLPTALGLELVLFPDGTALAGVVVRASGHEVVHRRATDRAATSHPVVVGVAGGTADRALAAFLPVVPLVAECPTARAAAVVPGVQTYEAG